MAAAIPAAIAVGTSLLSKKAPKPAAAPDPLQQIELQAKLNRVGQETPFGSTQFVKNADGSFNQKQTLSPELMQAFRNALSISGRPQQQVEADPRLAGLAGALADRVGQRFGIEPSGQPLSFKPAGQPQAFPEPIAPPVQAQNPTPVVTPPPQVPIAPLPGRGAFNGNRANEFGRNIRLP